MTERSRVQDVLARARQAWFPLAFVALFAWLDWIMHRSATFVVFAGGIAVATVLYRAEIDREVRKHADLDAVPPAALTALRASPGLLYFLTRGKGTSGATGPVLLAVVGTLVALAVYGDRVDARLSGFYAARDRMLPGPARAVLALVLPLVVGFAVIHGNLGDLPALLGGSTSQRLSPAGLGFRFFAGTLLTSACTVLLLRRPAS